MGSNAAQVIYFHRYAAKYLLNFSFLMPKRTASEDESKWNTLAFSILDHTKGSFLTANWIIL
jgi:hypothetical protein